MRRRAHRVYQLLVTCVAAMVTMAGVHAALVDLDAFVELAIVDNGGLPLANGSTVLIIGSTDGVNNGFSGAGGTNLIYDSLVGDDVLLANIDIGNLGVNSNGTFDVTVQFDSDDIKYVYIRFFDQVSGGGHVTGLVWWGTSEVFEIPEAEFGVSEVQFDPNGELQVQNQDNFIVIPEPATANLMVLFFGMMWVVRNRMKKR